MWAFLSRRFRRWLLLAIGLPILARILERLGERLESTRGETDLTRGLRQGGQWLRHRRRGTGRAA